MGEEGGRRKVFSLVPPCLLVPLFLSSSYLLLPPASCLLPSIKNLDGGKENFGLDGIRNHCFVTGLPTCGANFIGVGLNVLNRL